jgi:hypothetical protein
VRKSQRESNNTHVLFLRLGAALDASAFLGSHREPDSSFDRNLIGMTRGAHSGERNSVVRLDVEMRQSVDLVEIVVFSDYCAIRILHNRRHHRYRGR